MVLVILTEELAPSISIIGSWIIYPGFFLHFISIQVTPGVSAGCFGEQLIPKHIFFSAQLYH